MGSEPPAATPPAYAYDPPCAEWAGWIEDTQRTWIAFIDVQGKPQFFLHRDETGAVLD